MANFNMNHCILGGRLTADPELQTTPSGISVTHFNIAVSRNVSKDAETKADFFQVDAWREMAENITRYFRKGSSICLIGRMENRVWNDQQGQKRYSTSFVAEKFFFVDSKAESPAATQQQPYQQPTQPQYNPAPSYMPDAYMNPPAYQEPAPNFEALSSDDELPF